MISKELKRRITTSIVLITIVLFCLFFNALSWLFLLTIVSLICWHEFISLSKKIWKNKTVIILPITASFLLLVLFLYTSYKLKIVRGDEAVLFVFLVCIFSDIGGYFVGKSVGGRKLTKISPNKTISGSIGSFLFSLFPIVIIFILQEKNINFNIILLCLILSFSCQIGDLIISYFKRMARVKDTGSILPGHGGMLDRIDGIIFAIPTLIPFL